MAEHELDQCWRKFVEFLGVEPRTVCGEFAPIPQPDPDCTTTVPDRETYREVQFLWVTEPRRSQ